MDAYIQLYIHNNIISLRYMHTMSYNTDTYLYNYVCAYIGHLLVHLFMHRYKIYASLSVLWLGSGYS